jgi:hypothetical protein
LRQLAQVAAGSRFADTGFVGEDAGRQGTPVVEREQHLAPCGVREQCRKGGDVDVASDEFCGVTHDRPPSRP